MAFLIMIPGIAGVDIAICAAFAYLVVIPFKAAGLAGCLALFPVAIALIFALVAIDICLIGFADVIDENVRRRRIEKCNG